MRKRKTIAQRRSIHHQQNNGYWVSRSILDFVINVLFPFNDLQKIESHPRFQREKKGWEAHVQTSLVACSQTLQMHQLLPDNTRESCCCISPALQCPKADQGVSNLPLISCICSLANEWSCDRPKAVLSAQSQHRWWPDAHIEKKFMDAASEYYNVPCKQ